MRLPVEPLSELPVEPLSELLVRPLSELTVFEVSYFYSSTGCCDFWCLVTASMASSGGSSTCLVYVVAADVKARSDSVYAAN